MENREAVRISSCCETEARDVDIGCLMTESGFECGMWGSAKWLAGKVTMVGETVINLVLGGSLHTVASASRAALSLRNMKSPSRSLALPIGCKKPVDVMRPDRHAG